MRNKCRWICLRSYAILRIENAEASYLLVTLIADPNVPAKVIERFKRDMWRCQKISIARVAIPPESLFFLWVASSYHQSIESNAGFCLDCICHKDEIICACISTFWNTWQNSSWFVQIANPIHQVIRLLIIRQAIEALQTERTDPTGKPQPVGYVTP